MREVPNETLLFALKSAPPEILERVLSAMSKRAAEILREDLADMGPQRVSEVEKAQRDIVTIVKRLQEEGKIVVGIRDDQELIP